MPPKPSPTAKPQTRYRNRQARDGEAIRAHSQESVDYRHRLADAEFDAERRALFLDVLEDVADVKIAARRIGMTHEQIYGRTRWDQAFRDAMENTLTERCIAKTARECGTAGGYKAGGRCRECRAAHHRPAQSHTQPHGARWSEAALRRRYRSKQTTVMA